MFKSLCVQRWCYSIAKRQHFILQSGEVDLGPMAVGWLIQCLLHDPNILSKEFDASQWLQAKNALWNESSVFGDLLLKKNQEVTSLVFEFEGTGQCVVIGPLTPRHPEGKVYYILPYCDENSE